MIGQTPIDRISADDLISPVSTEGTTPMVGAVLILRNSEALAGTADGLTWTSAPYRAQAEVQIGHTTSRCTSKEIL